MNAIPQLSNPLVRALDCGPLRIGSAEVEPRAMSITVDDRTMRLEPKTMQVLLCLAARAGEVVTREEVMAVVWPDVAVTDDVLNRATSLLRRALGDDARSPRYIATVPKVGYRLLAPVARIPQPDRESPSFPASDTSTTSAASTEPTTRRRRRFLIIGAFVGLAACLALLATLRDTNLLDRALARPTDAGTTMAERDALRTLRIVPVVSKPGRQADPALSGDGTRIAYASETEDGRWSIFVQMVDGGRPILLTSPQPDQQTNARGPVWSPDGSEIAWIERADAETCRIVRAPSLGGTARRVARCPRRLDTQMAWAPDSKALVLSGAQRAGSPYRLWQLALDRGELRPLTTPPDSLVGDTLPAWSATGDRLAFVRWETRATSDIYLAHADGSGVTQVTHDGRAITGLAFSPEGDAVISISNRGGQFALWRTSLESGASEWLGYAQPELNTLTLSRDGSRLVVAKDWVTTTVSRVDLERGGEPRVGVVPASNERDWGVELSADGREVIWISDRSGTPEIWSYRVGEQDAAPLTALAGPFIDTPRLSPDGASLLFEVHEGTNTGIYGLERGHERPRRLTPLDLTEQAPSWSHDGTAVFFASDRSGSWQIWQRPFSAEPHQPSRATQVTQQGAFAGFASADGQWLYFTRRNEPGLFRRPMSGGPIVRLADDLRPDDWRNLAIGHSAIFYLARHVGSSTSSLRQFVFETSQSETITTIEDMMLFSGLAVAPDGDSVLLSHVTQAEADLILLENTL